MPHINPTGNAALASAGTGDVLAGWIGGALGASCVRPTLAGAMRAVVVGERGSTARPPTRPAASGPLRAADLIEAMHALR